MKIQSEIWKPIPGFAGYEVSSFGRVRSHWWYVSGQGRGAREYRENEGWTLKIVVSESGHHRVFFGRGEQRGWRFVHRLVLEAFVGPCPDGFCCCHNNGVPGDNWVSNLRWDTYSANQIDSIKHGTHDPKRGERQRHSKLSVEKVRFIRGEGKNLTEKELGAKYGCCSTLIGRVRRYKSWAWVRP